MKLTKQAFVLCLIVMCVCSASAATKPLKVFILAGQSNMQGRARNSTLPQMLSHPDTAPMAKLMFDADNKPLPIKDVWIASMGVNKDQSEKFGQLECGYGYSGGGGLKIGPEMGFAITMQQQLKEPVLIIKTTWGGKSLFCDFRPPSAGQWDFGLDSLKNPKFDHDKVRADRRKNSGIYYRKMVDYVNKVLADIKRVYPDYDPKQGYEIAGFSWFQGVHDFGDDSTYPNLGTDGCYDEYSRLLGCLICDLRKEFKAPKMPFVIGVLGISGDLRHMKEGDPMISWVREFRKAMAAPASFAEFKGNVSAVYTDKYWDHELEGISLLWPKYKDKIGELKKQQVAHMENKPRLRRLQLNEENQARLEAYKMELFTPQGWKLFSEGNSNAAYHYLGSYKIYSRIGKAFADSIIEMSK